MVFLVFQRGGLGFENMKETSNSLNLVVNSLTLANVYCMTEKREEKVVLWLDRVCGATH